MAEPPSNGLAFSRRECTTETVKKQRSRAPKAAGCMGVLGALGSGLWVFLVGSDTAAGIHHSPVFS